MALSFHVMFYYHDALLFRVPVWGLIVFFYLGRRNTSKVFLYVFLRKQSAPDLTGEVHYGKCGFGEHLRVQLETHWARGGCVGHMEPAAVFGPSLDDV